MEESRRAQVRPSVMPGNSLRHLLHELHGDLTADTTCKGWKKRRRYIAPDLPVSSASRSGVVMAISFTCQNGTIPVPSIFMSARRQGPMQPLRHWCILHILPTTHNLVPVRTNQYVPGTDISDGNTLPNTLPNTQLVPAW